MIPSILIVARIPAGGMEVPVPPAYAPPAWFASAPGEEFVVSAWRTTLAWPDEYVELFWLHTQQGEFQGDSDGNRVFTIFHNPLDPPEPWYSHSHWFSVYDWDDLDWPICGEYSVGSFTDKFSGAHSEGSGTTLHTSPPFTLSSTSTSSDPASGVTVEIVSSDYRFAPTGQFAAVQHESLWFSATAPYFTDYSDSTVRILDSHNGVRVYSHTSIPPTVPRYNPATDNVHVLGFDGAVDNRILKYSFSDTIATTVLLQCTGLSSELDFQPDPADDLHLIWRDAAGGLQYAVCQDDALSSPLLLADFADYRFSFSLRTNDCGDLLMFNIADDGRPVFWTRYHDAAAWEMEILPIPPDGAQSIDGFINSDGGVSILVYRSTGPAVAHLWRSPSRGVPLQPRAFPSSDWAEIRQHDFTHAGNVGMLIEKTDATEWIVTNVSYSQTTAAGASWSMYP